VALPHEIVIVVGRTGSGKTQLLARLIGARHKRRITIDLLGECVELYPRALRARSVAQIVELMRRLHKADINQWHIVASIDVPHVGDLLALLCPTGTASDTSLSAAWGGIALEIFELDLVAPVDRSEKSTRAQIKTAYARGRHYGLSILAATQRPHMIDRISTAQATHVVTFQMHEPSDLKFLNDVGGKVFAEIARTGLEQYESAWYDARSGVIRVLDASYTKWREIPREGKHELGLLRE
jgi:energy-coupling factor transporter ATP-binding protein EcfA2